MQFFRYFPTVDYQIGANTVTMLNLTVHMKIQERIRQNITVFYDYIIQDGDRPDTVALKQYGSVDYTWIVLLMNNIFSLYDWPLNPSEFNNYIVDKYTTVANAQSQLTYKTVDGVVVDSITYNLLPADQRGVPSTAYDEELSKNETKRRIQLVPRQFVISLAQDLKQILSS